MHRSSLSPSFQLYPYISEDHNEEQYSRCVIVPAANARKVGTVMKNGNITEYRGPAVYTIRSNGRTNSIMEDSNKALGHRQPTEHPNDNPEQMRNGTHEYNTSYNNHSTNNIVYGTGQLSMRTPSEHHIASPGYMYPGTKAMAQSAKRVQEWQSHSPGSEVSFVIDSFTDTFRTDISLSDVEQQQKYRSRMPNRSSSFPTTSERMGHRTQYNTQRSAADDMQSLRSGYSDEVDNSSDDDTGLQKSFSNIQRPPEVDPCSRQNSNGSQSSLESSISFYTVYPSGDGFNQKPQQHKQQEKNKRQPPVMNSPAQELHQQSTRHQPTVSTEPYTGPTHSQAGAYGGQYRAPSEQSRVREINREADEASRQEQPQKTTSVFITYAEERHDKNFRKLVLQLTRTLLSNGIKVRLDMLESTLMSMSVSSWLDDNIQKCDFVVICVSQSYKSEVEQQMTATTPDPHSLHTRYIYNRLLTEYIQNGSLNFRFIPVLMGGATRKDLPSLCLDTHVYVWPQDYEAIIYRLFKKEKYIQPKVGPPPKCTVETYDSYDVKLQNAQANNPNYR